MLRTGAASRAAAAPLWPGMLPSSGALPAPRTLPPLHKRKRKRRPPRRSRTRSVVVGSAAVVGSLAAAAVVLVYTTAMTAPQQAATAADPVLGGGPGCEPTRTDQLVRGNGVGSTANGPDVILAFQHAYYVSRSGTAARTLTTADAAVPTAEVIGAGIASVPAGTQHCVLITPLADGRFDVVITEARPDAAVRTYRQFVTVTETGGVIAITKIAAPS
ncbi:hypothetical protein [Nocardia arizonensis]|uniref:hypothetical protein n=1 Tax=Nocardia arizonensis TaxID=1141647 RepID=UPI0012E1DF80|nr:hypothetical protein [Nocardia arizonensis]